MCGHVTTCSFRGSTKLPASLTRLSVQYNELTGAVDVTQLPESLRTLLLRGNEGLTGAENFTPTPPQHYY